MKFNFYFERFTDEFWIADMLKRDCMEYGVEVKTNVGPLPEKRNDEDVYVACKDINDLLELMPRIYDLAKEHGYNKIAGETKEKSFADEDIYRHGDSCDMLSFLHKIYQTKNERPGLPYNAGFVGPISTNSRDEQIADCLGARINSEGKIEIFFEELKNTKKLLEFLDEHDNKLKQVRTLYIDENLYEKNKFILDSVRKEMFYGANIILTNNETRNGVYPNSYYINTLNDVVSLYDHAKKATWKSAEVTEHDGIMIAKNVSSFITRTGENLVKLDKQERSCAVRSDDDKFIVSVCNDGEFKIEEYSINEIKHEENFNKVVLYYDKEIKDNINEYFNDKKSVIPDPKNEREVLDFLNELKYYAKDHNIPFEVSQTDEKFEKIADPNKFPTFITTYDNCFSPNYETNLDRCGLELYKRLYGKDFKPESLEKNLKETIKPKILLNF